MDTLRGGFDGTEDTDLPEDERESDSPPPGIGQDERRMQVRAYNFWAGLLEDRNFPSIEDLDPESLPEFGPHSVLLDFSRGPDDPGIAFLGEELAEECGAANLTPGTLGEVPSRSLLSRITDHYMQILANRTPIGFEAEFVNQRGITILYRGVLLPFSSDDDTIDFIYGVINWKELADQQTADELLLEIDQSLDAKASVAPGRADLPLTDWADGPRVDGGRSGLPSPAFGQDEAEEAVEPADMPGSPAETAAPDVALADWLDAARQMAIAARSNEERTRRALYEAIGRAWDFALAAAERPDEFARLVEEAGLTMQDRAPMTPVVKLVFGADYDKTRLTEYAAALTHARRHEIGQGELAAYLGKFEGGLKGVVQAERDLRRDDDASRPAKSGPRPAIARKLRAIQPRSFQELERTGDEFALVMVRRSPETGLVVLGEVPEDVSLIEKAARRLTG